MMPVIPKQGSHDPKSGTPPETDDRMGRLLSLLEDLRARNDEGWTAAELAAKLHIGKPTLWKRLKELGPLLVVGRRSIVDLCGRSTSVVCYRLKDEP